MKKLLTVFLATLLLLAAAVPALASPTGASPAEAALWQAQAPAPGGDRQKLTSLVGGEKTAEIFSQRVIQSGPVINNAPVPGPQSDNNGNILYYLSIGEFAASLRDNVYFWGNSMLNTCTYILDQSGGASNYLLYTGEWTLFGGGDAEKQQILSNCTPMPDEIPVYSESALLDGQLSMGDLFQEPYGRLCYLDYDGSTNYLINQYLRVIPPDPT